MKRTIFLMTILMMIIGFTNQSCKREGCTNPKAQNYNSKANTEDGSCIIYGCTNFTAANYDYEATNDDGSCIIYGCTNVNADNYDPNATNDDGSCIIYGCTDPTALNYDPDATHDDGSCTYASSTGEAMFWTDADYGVGYIDVYVDGLYEGQITGFYSSGVPDCGASGCVTIERDPGTYSYNAAAGGTTWSGSVTITAGGCYTMRLFVNSNSSLSSSNDVAYEDPIEMKLNQR